MKTRTLLAVLVVLLPACAARTTIEPIGKGATSYNVSVGGPMVASFGTYLPIPNVTAGATHGLTDNIDVGGSLYILPLFYQLIGFDVGATWYPIVDSNALTIAVQPRLMLFASFKESVSERLRVYPAVSASAAWRRGRDRAYAGFDAAIPISAPDYDPDPPPLVLSPFVGYRWALGASSRLITEIKWVGINVRTDATTDYVNPLGHGGLAPFIGYEFGF